MLALIALDLFVMGLTVNSQIALIVCVIIAGAFLGVNDTLVTTAVMEVSPVERPVASAAYSFVRFVGGAIAPWLAGELGVVQPAHPVLRRRRRRLPRSRGPVLRAGVPASRHSSCRGRRYRRR